MVAPVPRKHELCAVCREIRARSDLYERWFFAENFGDTASLQAIGAARGMCSPHARRLVERDAEIAISVVRFVMRAMSHAVRSQLRERHGYRDALTPQRLCPWCDTERDALSYALGDKQCSRGPLCAPHARIAAFFERHQHPPEQVPFGPGEPLSVLHSTGKAPNSSWWSSAIDALWQSLRTTCAPCLAARQAETSRIAFLRAGPSPREHWEAPTLCIAHHLALDLPDTDAYRREPDSTARPCDICTAMRHQANRIADLFAIAYRDRAFQLAYAAVPGLCLPHASRVLDEFSFVERGDFALQTATRVDAMAWELEERSSRGSWQYRDQGQYGNAEDLAARAWWLAAGGIWR